MNKAQEKSRGICGGGSRMVADNRQNDSQQNRCGYCNSEIEAAEIHRH